MPEPSFHTVNLQKWLERLRNGDRAAQNELLRACQVRLEQLSRRMLRKHPAVQRWADTGDVFQNAAIRLLRALEGTSVTDTRQFMNLAAAVIRRELIDLARHFHGPEGVGAHHVSTSPRDSGSPAVDPAVPDDEDLELWTALHNAVENLPVEEREVFGLTHYHGWTQQQIAKLFEVDERTVRRRLRRAIESLNETLGGRMPPD